MRSVRDALWMQAERALLDAFACLVVALDVVQNLVGIEIAVVVGNDDCFRMEIEDARAEGTDDEVVSFEGLVGRRWHVMLADNRRKVVDVEAVRVVASIPSDDIERMVVVYIGMNRIPGLDSNFKITRLIDGQWKLWQAKIPLAIRGMLQELTGLLREISWRWHDVTGVHRLETDESGCGGVSWLFIELHLVGHALGDDDVVLLMEWQGAHAGVQGAGSEVDEEAFVSAAVLIEVVHLLGGHTDAHLHIGVAQQDHAAGDGIALGSPVGALEMPHPHHVGLHIFGLGGVELLPSGHLGWWMDVIQRGGWANEPFRSEDFLRVESTIRTSELDVSLGWNLAEMGVVGHCVFSGIFIVGLAECS